MTAKGPDFIRKRLIAAGATNDDCEKYVQILRQFLGAQISKAKFEGEMLKVLPREKISTHNDIIREILRRAQLKRDGVPDLPVVTSISERPAARPRESRPSPALPSPAPRADRTIARKKRPRERDELEVEVRNPIPPVNSTLPKPVVVTTSGDGNRKGPDKTGGVKINADSTGPGPGVTAAAPSRSGSHAPAASRSSGPPLIGSGEAPTYSGLPYFPIRPGQAMDLELFLKLRQRVKRKATEEFNLIGVRDDAVALLLHGLEAHVKSLMEAGVRQRSSRQALRPHMNVQCGPVRSHDFREAALRNVNVLGDEAGLDLERLVMLLY